MDCLATILNAWKTSVVHMQQQEIPPPPVIPPESVPLRGLPPEFDLFQIFQPPFVPQSDMILAPLDQTKQNAPPQTESQIQTLLWMNLDSMLDKMPPGAALSSNQFAATFGPEAAAQLAKAGVTSIADTAKPGHQPHFLLEFNKAGAVQTKSGELDHANAVSFDYSKSPTGEVDLKNVHGLTAKGKSGVKSWSSATVDSVVIVHENNGNVKLTGNAHWMFLHGSGTYEFGPDGNQIAQAPQVPPPVPTSSTPIA
jgi:hypothetical protein